MLLRQDLKLKYYDMMVKHALHHSAYLDVAKYYYKVWETPSIKEDEDGAGKLVSLVANISSSWACSREAVRH
jgi:hypothetical protein